MQKWVVFRRGSEDKGRFSRKKGCGGLVKCGNHFRKLPAPLLIPILVALLSQCLVFGNQSRFESRNAERLLDGTRQNRSRSVQKTPWSNLLPVMTKLLLVLYLRPNKMKRNLFLLFINPLNAELIPIRHLLALVGVRHIVHVSRIRAKHRVTRILRGGWYLHTFRLWTEVSAEIDGVVRLLDNERTSG